MSKSRSATPTPNTYAHAHSNLPPSSSRTPANDPTTTTITTTTTHAPTAPPEISGDIPRPPPSASQFAHFHSFVSSQTTPDDLRQHLIRPRPSSPDTEASSMAKRMRRHSPSGSPRSQSSDSRLADTEDPSRSSSDASRGAAPLPLKKKRTRTLTTPHQSAVLHALLAQSRFPTTAMREEVGRAIGLSARKVQIWFQNQRQKARRPGAQQSDSSAHAHAASAQRQQYGSYVNIAAPAIFPGAEGDASGRGMVIPHAYSAYSAAEQQLLGPGMPGSSSQGTQPVRGRPILQISPTQYGRELPPPAPSPFASRSLQHRVSLPLDEPGSFRPPAHAHDPARTLPPLDFSQPARRTSSSAGLDLTLQSPSYLLGGSAPPTPFRASPPGSASFRGSPPASQSRSPSPPFAHLPPPATMPQAPYPSSSTALGLPPPFTLQPQPQWERRPPTGSPPWSHSGSVSGSAPVSARPGSHSPPALPSLRTPSPADGDDNTPRLEPAQAPGRAGRYDPVRAAFVPYSPTGNTPPPGAPSPPT